MPHSDRLSATISKASKLKIDRLLTAVAEGTVPDASQLRKKMNDINGRRDECLNLLRTPGNELPEIRQALSKQQAAGIAGNLKRRLLEAPRALQKRYVHGLVSEIVVDREKPVISGPREAAAAAVSAPDELGGLLGSVREWRTGEDESANWTILVERALAGKTRENWNAFEEG
jgi:hypothetical protein